MADSAQLRITADTSDAERALGRLNSAIKGLATVATITALAKFADSLTGLQNKLSLVTQQGQSTSDAFNIVAKSALNLGAPLKDVGDLFFRVANNTKDLSLTQRDQIAITETLIKGFQMTGASMGEVQGGIVQLGQAFAQGVLRGDELNSVMEQLPMVADALAAKFGVQRGALKALGEQGKISSKDLADAILASGAAIDQAWGNRLPTIAQSFNTLQTAMGVAFSRFDEGTGLSQAMSLALLKIANALVSVIDFFETWGKWIAIAIGLVASLLIPVRVAISAFTVMGGALEFVIGPFRTLIGLIEGGTSVFTKFFAGTMLGAAAGGLYQVGSAIAGLFSSDKKEAANKYQEELDKLNKKLGLDSVEASNKAIEASKALSAQQIRDAEAFRKANQSRDIELKKIIQSQQDSLALTKFTGDAESIEGTILKTNRDLIKEVMNDKQQIIGYTKGLNTEEERNMRIMLQQLEIAKQQQALRALTGPESTSAVTSRASSIFGNTQEGLKVESQRQMDALKVLRQNQLITDQEYSDQALLIEQQRADAIIALDQKVAASRMKLAGVTNQAIIDAVAAQMANVKMMQAGGIAGAQGALGAMMAITGTMANSSQKAFEMHKKLAIAQALISTYQAAAMSIAAPPGPPWSYIYVATAIAAGLAQVATIQSQQFSGRALGGPVMGNTPYIVGERGPELFTPASSGSITRNDGLSSGTVNVNFSIVANDTNGFDSLLNSRKGMIKQMISDAMLEKGQRF